MTILMASPRNYSQPQLNTTLSSSITKTTSMFVFKRPFECGYLQQQQSGFFCLLHMYMRCAFKKPLPRKVGVVARREMPIKARKQRR